MSPAQQRSSRSIRSRYVIAVLSAAISLCVVLAISEFSSAQNRKEVPVSIKNFDWAVDRRALGFVADPVLARLPRVATFPAVQFISDSNVAVTFITREPVSGLQRRDDPNRQLPFKLHEVVLDVANGKEKARNDWPNDDPNIGIVSRPDDSFILFSRNFLSLYSADDRILKQTELTPKENASAELVGVDPSPSRNSFLVRYRVGAVLECDWINVPAMTVSKGGCDLSFRTAVSDQGTAIAAPVKDRPRDLQVQVQMLKEPWKILCDTKIVAGCGSPWFVDNHSMLIHTNRELDLLDVDGVVAMRKVIVTGHNEVLNPDEAISSPQGSHRIAISVSRSEATYDGMFIDWDDVFFEVRVYDMSSQSWIFVLQNDSRIASGDHRRDGHPFTQLDGLALSPNGKKLVIEFDGKILGYTLPR